MAVFLPAVGWIIITTSTARLETYIQENLLEWLHSTGWSEQVKIVVSLTENVEEEAIELIAHHFQSNPSAALPLSTEVESEFAISFTKKWLSQIVDSQNMQIQLNTRV